MRVNISHLLRLPWRATLGVFDGEAQHTVPFTLTMETWPLFSATGPTVELAPIPVLITSDPKMALTRSALVLSPLEGSLLFAAAELDRFYAADWPALIKSLRSTRPLTWATVSSAPDLDPDEAGWWPLEKILTRLRATLVSVDAGSEDE